MSAAVTSSEPAWLTTLRGREREFAATENLPSRELEAWRKVNLSGLSTAGRLNAARPSRLDLSGPGVESLALDNAAEEIAAFAEEALTHYDAAERRNYFTALAGATAGEHLIRLSGTAAEPVRLKHGAPEAGATTVCPRTLLFIEGGAEVTVVEEFAFNESGADAGGGDDLRLVVPMTDIYLASNARLNYVMVGDFGPDDVHIHHLRARQMRDSRLNLFLFPLGGFSGKSFYTNEAREVGAECHAIGCSVGQGREFNDMDLTMSHYADHTISSILYRSVVRDRSHHVFYGNLEIEKGLKGVDSHQSNNNILLDRRARAESMPNLIVRAEDVAAEHGATVGELDKEALYFLMARGIPEKEARDLLIDGFINSILEKLPGEELQEEIGGRLKARL